MPTISNGRARRPLPNVVARSSITDDDVRRGGHVPPHINLGIDTSPKKIVGVEL